MIWAFLSLMLLILLFTNTTYILAETTEQADQSEDVDLSEEQPLPEVELDDDLITGTIGVQIVSSQERSYTGILFGVYADEACTQEEEQILFQDSDLCEGDKEYDQNRTLYVKQIVTNEFYQKNDTAFPVIVTEKKTVIEVELYPIEIEDLPFSDVPDSEQSYYDALIWIRDAGLFSGYADGSFGIGDPAARGDAFRMLYEYAGEPQTVMQNYALTSVEDMDLYAPEAGWAYETGMLHGFSKKYRKDEAITRAEAIYAFWIMNGSPAVKYKGTYSDVTSDDYYASAAAWSLKHGLTAGSSDHEFFPDAALKREDFAKLLYRFYIKGLSVSTKTVYVETPLLTRISNKKSGITLTWNEVPGAYQYRIYRKKANTSGWKKIADVQGVTSYTIKTGLVEGRADRYTVRCIAKDGSASSGYDTTGLSMAWIPYTKVSLKSVSKGIKISWTAVSCADGYHLYRKGKGDGSWTEIKKITKQAAETYTDKSAEPGKEYAYRIQAYKTIGGKQYSGYGDKGKTITKWLPAPVLTSVKNSASGITVKWKAVPGAKQYRIYRRSANDSKWKKVASTADTSYKDKASIKAGIEYFYTVRCINADGTLASKYDTKGRSAKRMLADPQLISARNDGDGSIVIRWEAVSGAEKYRIYRRASAKASWKRIGDTEDTSFTDSAEITPGKKYYYTVRCVSLDGKIRQSGYHTTGIVVTKQLATPELISAIQNGNAVTIRWKAVKGARQYRILRKEPGGSWKTIADLKKTTYTDKKDMLDNKTYFYTVRCVSADGKANESACDTTGVSLIYHSSNLPVQPTSLSEIGNAVFIGDSWTKGVGTSVRSKRFSTRISNMLGMEEFNFGVGGAGFIRPMKPFSAELTKAVETMTDQQKEQTQYVFIVGGINDTRHHGSEEYFETYSRAVYDTCLTALDHFPNAKIILAQGTLIESGGLQSYHDMIDYCNTFLDRNLDSTRVIRVPNIGMLFAKANAVYWKKDGLHLTDAGHSLLASYLYAYVYGGSMNVSQYCGTAAAESIASAEKAIEIWKSEDSVYIKSGTYLLGKTISAGMETKIGSISIYFAPITEVSCIVYSGTKEIGTIRIASDGAISFTPYTDFKGKINIPQISWACLGEDNTKGLI